MSKKPVTTEEKQHIAALAANNRSVTAIARETGLHALTIKKQLLEPSTAEMIEVAGKILAEKMQTRIEQIVHAISDEDIEKASLRDKCVAVGVLQDKCRQAYQMDKPAPLININLNGECPIDLSGY